MSEEIHPECMAEEAQELRMPSERRVLIFDDEPAVCRALIQFASFLNAEPIAVSTADLFFDTLEHWNPTHIILDLRMPNMDGVEVIEELVRMGCKANIAISSGSDERVLTSVQRSVTQHGLKQAELLAKPVTLATLRAFLERESGISPPINVESLQPVRVSETVTQAELSCAIQQHQLIVAMQPIISCSDLNVRGFEVLVRWLHPTKGVIMPDKFIALAEREGLIDAITDQVLDLSLKWLAELTNVGTLSISINLSGKSLGNHDLPGELDAKCQKLGIASNRVIVEVTETAVEESQLLALDVLNRLRLKGFQISMDDFGIGNSTLATLANLPFSELKLDRYFSITALTSKDSRAIIKSTVNLGHELGLTVVAEGIENQETLDLVRQLGCDFAQGYFIARPMGSDKVEGWMRHQQI